MFRQASCFAFHLIGHVNIRMGVENLTPACGHFGFRGTGRTVRAAFADIDAGVAFDFLFGFNVRRDLDHAAHIHMIVVVFPFIGIGVYLVGGHHIALAGLKLRPFFQFRFGIHLHRVVGVGPCHADDPACAGFGGSPGRNLLQASDVGIFRHIPRAGQGGRIGGLGAHRNGRRGAPGRNTAGIAVRKAVGRSVAGSADFQVFQFGGRVGVGSAFGRHQALIVAGGLGVAGADGNAQPDGRVA